jgi:hypothetical protein
MKNVFLTVLILLLCQQTYLSAQQSRPKSNTSTTTKPATSTTNNSGTTTTRPKAGSTVKSTTTTTNNTPKNTTKNPKAKNGFFFGGGVNMTTDGAHYAIDANPYLGYRPMNKAQLGIGPTIQYRPQSTVPLLIGARGFGRYDIMPNIYLQAQYEALGYQPSNTGESKTAIVQRLPIGGGYNHRLFGINANFTVSYDLLYNKATSPFSSPLTVTGGFNLGK